MDIKIEEAQAQIRKQKALAEINFFGAFKDGYIAALDIIDVFVKSHEEPKCVECDALLSESESPEGDTCDKCYKRLSDEHYAESSR